MAENKPTIDGKEIELFDEAVRSFGEFLGVDDLDDVKRKIEEICGQNIKEIKEKYYGYEIINKDGYKKYYTKDLKRITGWYEET